LAYHKIQFKQYTQVKNTHNSIFKNVLMNKMLSYIVDHFKT